MSRRARVKADWLDSMLLRWASHDHRTAGYPSICPMLQSGIPSGKRSSEPTGVTSEDWTDLDAAINGLEPWLQAAIIRSYRQWTAKTIDSLWPDLAAWQWSRWLEKAGEQLAEKMARLDKATNRN